MTLSEFFNNKNFNLQQIVTPCIGTKNKLLIFRLCALVVLLYGLWVSIYNFNYNFRTNELRIYLPYFTHQTYFCIIIYFILNIYFQIKDKSNALPKRFKNEDLNVFIQVFYNALTPLAFLVTLVFWSLIYPVLDFSRCNYLNYSQHFILHLFQSISLGTDWFLTSVPTSRTHTIPMVAIGITYIIFAQIYHALYGDWIYDFIDTSKPNWYITYTVVILFWILFGFVFTIVHEKKNEYCKKFNKKTNKKAN